MYSKMNKFAANTSAILILLVVATTTVNATHPKFKVQVSEDNAEQPATSPEKVNTLF